MALLISCVPNTSFYNVASPATVSAGTKKLSLKNGEHDQYIDRMNFPQYALDFYESLEKNSKNAGGYLIDVTQAYYENGIYYKEVANINGTYSTYSEDDLKNYIENAATTSNVTAYLYEAYFAFFCDHPEVFWISQSPKLKYMYTAHYNRENDNYEYEITYVLVLKYSAEGYDIRDTKKYKSVSSLIKAIKKRDTLVKKIVKKYKNKSAYKTVQGFNKYLITKNAYNTYVLKGKKKESEYTHHAMCALEGNKGKKGPICMSYSAAMKVLCDAANIPCIMVCGDATNAKGETGGHQWNNVKLENGKWYAVDCTWNDTGSDKEAFLCVGSKSKIAGVTFTKSHKILNKGYEGLKGLTNQPAMAKGKYKYDGYRITLKKTDFVFNGKSIKPSVKVVNAKGKKVAKKNYKVTYKNNKNVGTATVIVKFKKKLKKVATKKAEFVIRPKQVSVLSITPFSDSAFIMLDSSTQKVDGYEVLYSKDSYFNMANTSLAYASSSENGVTLEGLEGGSTYYIKVRGYIIKNGKYYYSNYGSRYSVTI